MRRKIDGRRPSMLTARPQSPAPWRRPSQGRLAEIASYCSFPHSQSSGTRACLPGHNDSQTAQFDGSKYVQLDSRETDIYVDMDTDNRLVSASLDGKHRHRIGAIL